MRKALSRRLHNGESEGRGMKKKHWYDYLWAYAIVYFALGFFNILFAWLGMIVMVLYKPRTWCAFCPMGTMTQSICKLKSKNN